jgi:large subunit ribosomal protein L25
MQETFELKAEVRTDAGKGASRRLRRSGMVPGIIYGGDKDPQMVALEHNDLVQHLEHEAFYSHILALDVAGTAESVVLKDLQRHPAKPLLMHIDFQRVRADEKIRMQVPLHFLNEAAAPGVKQGGQVSHHLTGVEVSCLPKDLPEFIAVDVGAMGMGDALHLSELRLPEGVSLVALSHGDDALVVTLHTAHAVEEETPAAGPGAPGGETPAA